MLKTLLDSITEPSGELNVYSAASGCTANIWSNCSGRYFGGHECFCEDTYVEGSVSLNLLPNESVKVLLDFVRIDS